MKEINKDTTVSKNGLLGLPVKCQVAILSQIEDDKDLVKTLTANRYLFGLSQTQRNIIFKPRASRLTDYVSPSAAYATYKDYVTNKNESRPFCKEIEENHTALSYMVFRGYEKAVAAYIKTLSSRDELSHKVRNGYNLLDLAIVSQNPKMVELILSWPEASVWINEKDAYSDKAIHRAAKVGNRLILELICKHQTFNKDQINERGHGGYSPLANFCVYAERDDTEFVNDLIEYGAKVDESSLGEDKCINGIPAKLAIRHHKPEVAKVLLGYIKKNLRQYEWNPSNMLESAIREGYLDIVKLLVDECHVEVDNTVDPYKSLLRDSIAHFNLELIEIVFRIESRLYKKTPAQVAEVGEPSSKLPYGSSDFSNYMLLAMLALLAVPANSKTLDTCNLLIKLGFDISMVESFGGCNIFHLIVAQWESFINNKSSVPYAKEMIFHLVDKDVLDFRHKADHNGVFPSQYVVFKDGSSSLVFEEQVLRILDCLSESEEKSEEVSQQVDQDSLDLPRYSHDEEHRGGCNIM